MKRNTFDSDAIPKRDRECVRCAHFLFFRFANTTHTHNPNVCQHLKCMCYHYCLFIAMTKTDDNKHPSAEKRQAPKVLWLCRYIRPNSKIVTHKTTNKQKKNVKTRKQKEAVSVCISFCFLFSSPSCCGERIGSDCVYVSNKFVTVKRTSTWTIALAKDEKYFQLQQITDISVLKRLSDRVHPNKKRT